MNRRTNKSFYAVVLAILGSFFIFNFAGAVSTIVAKPIEKNNYVLAISEQEGSEADIQIARNKFCLVVCFVQELIPNLTHIRRSLRDLFSGDAKEKSVVENSILSTTPEPLKTFGASLKDISIEIVSRTELLADEFSSGVRDLAKESRKFSARRSLPKITVSISRP
ncbi:MAG: hypothetical protein G01um10143_411 [Parcubacteria group bacterium Gr01-1014_3]|nr:MAG: hypothetical protein G01um10143_411 [Parcubacteria group bacterium Gr01-1014_3]